MGKKGKGPKKDDKPKKEAPQKPATQKKAVQEALEGSNVTVSTPTARPSAPAPRTTASKKPDRVTKIGCSERFRWDNSTEAPVLPPIVLKDRISRYGGRFHRELFTVQIFQALRHWSHYLAWRCNDMVESARHNKTLKDGLSGPLSIASMIIHWVTNNPKTEAEVLMGLVDLETGEPLHIVVVGATAGYEEKILRESDYWDDLLAILGKRKVRLYLTGPEMSGKDGEFKRKKPGAEEGQQQGEDGSRVECWKASAVDFFLKKGRLELFKKEDTVVVGLNCGFDVAARNMLNTASSKHDLSSNQVLWNWIPTLHFIAALELPLMITGSSLEDVVCTRLVLEFVVGMYSVLEANTLPTPFESATIPGPGLEVRKANTFFTIVQGQQPGHRFAAEAPSPGEKDPRFEELRQVVTRSRLQPSRKWQSTPERFQHKGIRERASPLVPLKRYGNYPPENREKCTPDDDGESESDVPIGAERRKEKEGSLPPAVVKLKHSVVGEGSDSLKIIVEDVFMTDPGTARVGMRRNSFTLHYFDCQTLRDAVFEAALPKEVDHTTTQIIFQRSAPSVTIVVRLLESKK